MADTTPAGAPAQAPAKPIPQNMRNFHAKALSALERSPDLAINMLLQCVQACPWFDEARGNLRKATIARYLQKHGGHAPANPLAGASAVFQKMKVNGLVKKGKFDEAIAECEKLLEKDPLNVHLVKLFAETAIAAGRPVVAHETLDIVQAHTDPTNLATIEAVGRLFLQLKDYPRARECLERVHRAKPADAEINRILKDTEALATLNSGWEQAAKSGNYRDTLANKKQAEELEAAAKSVKTASDAETLIADAIRKVQKEPKNVNYYLSLVGLFLQQKRYDEGLQWIAKAREIIGQDPELDRRYSAVKIEKFDADIAALQEAGEAEKAAEMQAERDQYVFDDIAERVQRYPNDQHLRYELGAQYYKYGYPDEAIQQFQISQRSPKDRVQSLYLMAECFRQKGMLDMAVEQLRTALEQLPGMNAEKMDVYYLLGEISEQQGNLAEASKYFKEIYRADVTYKDISARVQRIYEAQKAQG